MNFSEFSFWWILLLFCVPFFTVRFVGQICNVWRGIFDTVGIAALSLILFFKASPTSFFVFLIQILFNYWMVRWMITRPPQQELEIAISPTGIWRHSSGGVLLHFPDGGLCCGFIEGAPQKAH